MSGDPIGHLGLELLTKRRILGNPLLDAIATLLCGRQDLLHESSNHLASFDCGDGELARLHPGETFRLLLRPLCCLLSEDGRFSGLLCR